MKENSVDENLVKWNDIFKNLIVDAKELTKDLLQGINYVLGGGVLLLAIGFMNVYFIVVRNLQMGPERARLPWLNSFGTRTRVVGQLRSEKDIQRSLETHFFDRKERDVPQGRGEHLAVAYGIEKVNKLFLASNPPIEIPLPPPKKRGTVFTVCPLRLEVAGENLSSTVSEGTVIMADSWNNLGVPEKVTTIRTPSKARNLLLRLGIGRDVKVLGSKNDQED